EYVRRDMALPDDASVELAVTLGTTRLSLRQAMGLAVGEVIALGRPLGGPFDVRAAGQVVGKGELVDVDGELAVRIVSLEK
ncbi:MAG TPA: FliM/FliN family flagellar motor C-terminal domain-containing protein, partial [Kofleriaceae bacterium]|nr:FliM/FliN family flagellar motor C-terminal domain-containing protein [Kofleriaceae bacterium]